MLGTNQKRSRWHFAEKPVCVFYVPASLRVLPRMRIQRQNPSLAGIAKSTYRFSVPSGQRNATCGFHSAQTRKKEQENLYIVIKTFLNPPCSTWWCKRDANWVCPESRFRDVGPKREDVRLTWIHGIASVAVYVYATLAITQ